MGAAREELRTFLLHHELGATRTLEARASRRALRRLLRHGLGDLSVGFDVAPKGLPAWQEPRRLGSIAEDLDQLQVGMKKKLFRRDLTREMMRVADHYVLSATVETRRATVEIAKKLDGSKPPLLLELELEEDGIYAHIERTSSSEGASLLPRRAERRREVWRVSFAVLQRVARDAHAQRIGVCCADRRRRSHLGRPGAPRVPGRALGTGRGRDRTSEARRLASSPLKVEHEDGRCEERYLDRQLVDALLDDSAPRARAWCAAQPGRVFRAGATLRQGDLAKHGKTSRTRRSALFGRRTFAGPGTRLSQLLLGPLPRRSIDEHQALALFVALAMVGCGDDDGMIEVDGGPIGTDGDVMLPGQRSAA
ncbi:MAG: hypothetical protein R3B99_27475 [Polyangiales bacterium]